MKKTLTALRAFGCAKKHILVAILLSSLMSNAYGDEERYRIEDEQITIFGDCTLSEINGWLEQAKKDEIYVQFIEITSLEKAQDVITVTVDEYAKLPDVGIMYFTGDCNLLFNTLTTLQGGTPMVYVGEFMGDVPANLTLTFTDDAINNALNGKDVSNLVQIPLVADSMFASYEDSNVSFTFGDAGQGQKYSYTYGEGAEQVTQEYTNVGIIPPTEELERDTAALLFEQGVWDPEQPFPTRTFIVAFVGSSYVPVPEPTTGTLSLLALAGLAARRRRK